jgi:hypothetical protein
MDNGVVEFLWWKLGVMLVILVLYRLFFGLDITDLPPQQGTDKRLGEEDQPK